MCDVFNTLAIVENEGYLDLPYASQRLLLLNVVAFNPLFIANLDALTFCSWATRSIAIHIVLCVIIIKNPWVHNMDYIMLYIRI